MCNCDKCQGVIETLDDEIIFSCKHCDDAILINDTYAMLGDDAYCEHCLTHHTSMEIVEMLGGEIYGD